MSIEVLADPDSVAGRAAALIAEEARTSVPTNPCWLVILFAKASTGASPPCWPEEINHDRCRTRPTRDQHHPHTVD
jgi:hypothetical protein